jgi:hypothetical protein
MIPHIAHVTWEAMPRVGDLLLLLRLVLGPTGSCEVGGGQPLRLAVAAVGSTAGVAEERHWRGTAAFCLQLGSIGGTN